MHRRLPALGLAAVLLTPVAVQAQAPGSAPDLVAALEGTFGVHPGLRRSHAKGYCAEGSFTATGAGARLSTAASLAPGATLPVTARFSLGGGNPRAADTAQGVRGLAFAMTLPGNQQHHFVMLSVPVFAARTPETFAGLTRAVAPDPATRAPDPAKVTAFVEAHPDVLPLRAYLRDNPVSTSYATAPYFGIHTFFATDAVGGRHPIRWVFEPEAGREAISAEQRQALGPDFLETELRERLARGPVAWKVFMILGQPDDPVNDATQAWPATRERIEVARLVITGMQPAGEKGSCDPMMFSPLALPTGLAGSDDPILQARPGAYGVSLLRRRAS